MEGSGKRSISWQANFKNFELVKSPPGADSEVLAACLLPVFGVLWLARAPSSNYMGTSA
jgi:hypothetical protein|tara:strand:- start:137 stop:313 length:177 start_codon:yes stop_codon:yes gene_type:complete